MTNLEKQELRRLAKAGYTFKQIRSEVDCSDVTIRRYIKVFAPAPKDGSENKETESSND